MIRGTVIRQAVDMEMIQEKLGYLESSFKDLGQLAKILGCLGVWQTFDKLRSEDRPFDRSRFIHAVEQAIEWAPRWVQQRYTNPEAENASPEPVEAYTGELYAKSWISYEQEEFLATSGFFEQRLRNNGVDVGFIRGRIVSTPVAEVGDIP